MKAIKIVLLLIVWGHVSYGNDSTTLHQISDNILLYGRCYDDLKVLCKDIGRRISGSSQSQLAIAWGVQSLRKAGADTVWLQPVWVPHWVRGSESLQIKKDQSDSYQYVSVSSLGNSVGTHGKTLELEVVMVNSFEELDQLPSSRTKGKAIFYNYRFRQDFVSTFRGYSDAVRFRTQGPSRAAAKGAFAIIIRSVSTAADDVPHTGVTFYTDSLPRIPAVAVGNSTADDLEIACKKGTVSIRLQSECQMKEPVLSWNVIGELKGRDYPDEIIVAGGHLDSWDVGEGAHDDGAGCVQAIEVIRTFQSLHIKPKRTIRAVLFMNEENGAKGGSAYTDSAAAKSEQHILAIESDAGGFSPRGFSLDMSEDKKQVVRRYATQLLPYGIYDLEQSGGGVDIDPLRRLGTPLAGLVPDSQRYFDLHHSNDDIFERINSRELKLGAVAITGLIYLVSEYGL